MLCITLKIDVLLTKKINPLHSPVVYIWGHPTDRRFSRKIIVGSKIFVFVAYTDFKGFETVRRRIPMLICVQHACATQQFKAPSCFVPCSYCTEVLIRRTTLLIPNHMYRMVTSHDSYLTTRNRKVEIFRVLTSCLI